MENSYTKWLENQETKLEIMESNKLIAEFMDIDEVDIDCAIEDYGELKYHTSWDWLMPVVEKCLEKHNNLIDGRDIVVTPYAQIVEGLKVASLKETYNAVVEFIKSLHFYNQLK